MADTPQQAEALEDAQTMKEQQHSAVERIQEE